jgi:hypothetical protein
MSTEKDRQRALRYRKLALAEQDRRKATSCIELPMRPSKARCARSTACTAIGLRSLRPF